MDKGEIKRLADSRVISEHESSRVCNTMDVCDERSSRLKLKD